MQRRTGLTTASSDSVVGVHRQSRNVLFNVPTPKNEDRAHAFRFIRDQEDLRQHYLKRAKEVLPAVLGPMPAQLFLDEFLPTSSGAGTLSGLNPFRRILRTGSQSMLSGDGVNALNGRGLFAPVCPGFVFDDAAVVPEDQSEVRKSYLYCYSEESLQRMKDSGHARDAHLGFAEFFIEVRDAGQDIFIDPPRGAACSSHNFLAGLDGFSIDSERTQEEAQEILGRHVARVAETCSRQYRTHYFSIMLNGPLARLIRWDRAGAIVTEAFDVHEDPHLLYQFTQRYAYGPDEMRGLDTTIGPAQSDDEALFLTSITAHVKRQLGVEGEVAESAVLEHYKPGKVAAVTVNSGDDGAQTTRLLISRPVLANSTLFSKATRGYWCVDSAGHVVFLKDMWRHTKCFRVEGDVIEALHRAGVRNIPDVVQHGHVPRFPSNQQDSRLDDHTEYSTLTDLQDTLSDKFLDADWVCSDQRKLRPHIHYRLVLGTVGYPLKRFTGTKELLHATFDAFEAMVGAHEAGWLHRDISAGNILLVREGSTGVRRGYLIDWEMARGVDTNQLDQLGTFQFKGHRLLGEDRVTHTLADDMESMLWVVLYCSLLWLPVHELHPGARWNTIGEMFEARRVSPTGRVVGGHGKIANMRTRRFTNNVEFDNTQLQTWLTTVMDYHAPLETAGPELRGKWDGPRHLLEFWRGFLERESPALPENERYVGFFVAPPSMDSSFSV
ncbi:hypothetical protein B0H21DRAFT_762822 [Amylocystis lapponica]|nr:hypothetical protein B0H21DRAFT_762822 [Amylocystis lapponica]